MSLFAARAHAGSAAGPGIAARIASAWGSGHSRAAWAVLALLMVAFTIPELVNHLHGLNTKDYPLWFETGYHVLRGHQLYPRDQMFPFMYPPLAAILLAPLCVCGQTVMMLALAAINSAAWVASILLSVYLVTGRVWRQHPLLYLAPTLCTLPFVWDTYFLGQPNLLLLALMLGSFACLRNRYQWSAGMLIALAAAIKAFPILAVVYLVYRRQWQAVLGAGVGVTLFFVLIPVAVRGPRQGIEDVTVWTKGMVLKYDQGNVGQRTARAYSWKNQSLVGVANRLLRDVSADENPDRNYRVNVANLDFRALNAVIVGAALGLCLFYVRTMPRRSARNPETDAIEQAMLLLLILLLSPYSFFGYYFVWLLYPFAVMTHLWLTAPPGGRDARILLAIGVGVLTVLSLALPWKREAHAYGNHFIGCVILLGALGWQLQKRARSETLAC